MLMYEAKAEQRSENIYIIVLTYYIRGYIMKHFMYAAFLAAVVLTSGCIYRQTPASNLNYLPTVDFSRIDEMKKGIACETDLFGFLSLEGSQSVVDAAKQGGLSKVLLVDRDTTWYILWTKTCTVVYGE